MHACMCMCASCFALLCTHPGKHTMAPTSPRLYLTVCPDCHLHHLPPLPSPSHPLNTHTHPTIPHPATIPAPRTRPPCRPLSPRRQANQAANHEPLYIRQATVWLPLLSLYFASSLMIADARRTRLEWGKGNTPVAALFATSFACDVVDVAAQVGGTVAAVT